jgi:hypothetical protein
LRAPLSWVMPSCPAAPTCPRRCTGAARECVCLLLELLLLLLLCCECCCAVKPVSGSCVALVTRPCCVGPPPLPPVLSTSSRTQRAAAWRTKWTWPGACGCGRQPGSGQAHTALSTGAQCLAVVSLARCCTLVWLSHLTCSPTHLQVSRGGAAGHAGCHAPSAHLTRRRHGRLPQVCVGPTVGAAGGCREL